MGRQYTIEHYLERLARIREAVPGIAISTDVIVGFCGETEAQFEATLRLLETVRYDQVFAAAYSPRPGTPATRLADDVPADDKRRRLNELLALQEGIGLERNRAWLGREVEVLVDARRRRRARTTTSHDDGRDGRPTRRPSPTGCRAGPARNKLVHLAGDPDAGRPDRRRPRSTTPGRTRCGARSSARDRRDRRRRRSIVVAGATATGKTELAIRLAEALAGDGRPAGDHLGRFAPGLSAASTSGRPRSTAADRARVPHFGLDLVDPDEPFSVADFVDARRRRPGATWRRAAASRSSPAAPGSTCGRSPAAWTRPPCRATRTSAPASRRTSRPTACRRSSTRLEALAPTLAARIDLRNPRRVVRALEIAELAGDVAAARRRAATRARSPGSASRWTRRRTRAGSRPGPAPSSTPA